MILQFCDRDDVKAHDHFQVWRRKHPAGFFLNCKSPTVWMLHRALCHHHGGTDFRAEDWASLTRRTKICSIDRSELLELVQKPDGPELKTCSDCNP
jgi:hypothetical protein